MKAFVVSEIDGQLWCEVGETTAAARDESDVLVKVDFSGFFAPRITLKSYFDNAQGLRQGAPVRLSGVDIGNVTNIRIVPDKDKQLTPVEITMKLSTKYGYDLRRDSVTSLDTAGVLGETYLDIESAQAVGPPAQDGDTLPTQVHPDFNQVV